jgi:hypothetical protein
MTEPGDLVKCKKRCCRSGTRCKRCPVVWKRLSRAGLAERQTKRRYVVVEVVPKKALKAARRARLSPRR